MRPSSRITIGWRVTFSDTNNQSHVCCTQSVGSVGTSATFKSPNFESVFLPRQILDSNTPTPQTISRTFFPARFSFPLEPNPATSSLITMMINMIFKILLPLTVWCMGVVAQDVFEVPGTAEGSIATSCEKLYLHFANTTHNQVTLSLFGFCTYDGQPHDFVSEPQLFRKTGIDLSHVVINDKQNFCWAAKDIK